MRNGLQNQFTAMGDSSCYFLCLCKIAEEVIGGVDLDVIHSFDECVKRNYIKYNYADPGHADNCFVLDPVRILGEITGRAWSLRKITDPQQIMGWKAGDNEYTVQRWCRKTTGKEITHFRRPTWDSLLNSQTVKYGAIDALYIFTVGGNKV